MPDGNSISLFSMAESAMSAQLVRMNAATSNLANAGSVASSEAEAYRPIRAVFGAELDRATGLSSVRSEGLVRSDAAPSRRFEPNNPLADDTCLLYTSPSPRDLSTSRMPSSA